MFAGMKEIVEKKGNGYVVVEYLTMNLLYCNKGWGERNNIPPRQRHPDFQSIEK
jgi:hypothetical protein